MGQPAGERAVTPILGAVILAGFIVAGMAIYQAQVVPHQNMEIEFNHNERVEEDMISVRNALLQAHESGDDQFVTVELGTTYPVRLVGVNPPNPTGRLHSTRSRPIQIKNGSGSDVTGTVCPGGENSRFIAYSPQYNEYQNAPVFRYENSLVYKWFPQESVNLTMTGQKVVSDSTVNIYRTTGNYSLRGQGAVSFDVRAGTIKTTSVADPTVTLPTKLTESKWEQVLSGEVDPANVSTANGNLTLSLEGNYDVSCSPVEVTDGESDDESTPTPSPTPTATPTPDGSKAVFDNGANSDVFVVGVSQPYGSGPTNPKVDVTFENRNGETKTVVEARMLTYYDASAGQNKPVPAQMQIAQTTPWLGEGEPAQTLDSPFSIGVSSQKAVQLYFKGSGGSDSGIDLDDYVYVTLVFEDGTSSIYFIEFDGSN